MKDEFPGGSVNLYWCVEPVTNSVPAMIMSSRKYFGANRQIMERNEACPEILLVRLLRFFYLFPCHIPFCPSRYVGGLSIVSSRAFHVLSDARRVLLSLPLSLSFSCLTHFQKALYLLSRGMRYIMH